MSYDGPILDDHCHLDPEAGRGMDAVDDFDRAGGTHLMVCNRPSWDHGVEVDEAADFRPVLEATEATVERAAERLDGTAWPVLGVHPALVSRLLERGFDPDEAAELMQTGLDVAAEFAAAGPAVALKTGRPHYDVDDAVWDASNRVLRHGLELAAESGVAVQLHTESTDDLSAVGEWAADAGLAPERVVKHYAGGPTAGVTPSVIARPDPLREAAEAGDPFLMETDYLDDAERPGAVLGPKTVPRRVTSLADEGFDEALRTAHVEAPASVYGVDTTGTLAR